MIQPPRRSVTRFFIPMIDVLTLLFCIFLLMPFVKKAADTEGDPGRVPTPVLTGDQKADAAEMARLRAEVEQLRKEKAEELKRLEIRTLEIDPKTGDLIYYAPEPYRITSQADAVRLINGHREELRRAGGKELYYLFQFPRDPKSGAPSPEQWADYTRWFADVPFGVDNPLARR
ncbi:MAG: hypothetical protein ACJ8F7_03375 [Gemmataceae bacterium]